MEEQLTTPQDELLTQLEASGVRLWTHDGRLDLEAPKGVLTTQLTSQLQQYEADLADHGRCFRPRELNKEGARGATPNQSARQRLWFLDRIDARSSTYTTLLTLIIRGNLSVDHLEKSLNQMIARHACLRTAFTVCDDHYIHQVRPHSPCKLMMVNLSEVPEIIKKDEVRRIGRERLTQSFDLTSGLLLNAKLVRMSPTTHVLLITLPHMVSGQGAVGVLVRDLAEGYRAQAENREPHYRDMVSPNGKTLMFHYPVDCPAPLGRDHRNGMLTLSMVQELTSPSLLPTSPVMDFDVLSDPGVLARPEVSGGEPPKTALEHDLAEIWKEVLQTREVYLRDNFFALGGGIHSLDALLEMIHELFGVSLKRSALFDVQTLGGQVKLLTNHLPGDPDGDGMRSLRLQSTVRA